jgi:hypothetical protein
MLRPFSIVWDRDLPGPMDPKKVGFILLPADDNEPDSETSHF